VFPASEWGARDVATYFPSREIEGPDGGMIEQASPWELLPEREVPLKNVGSTPIREVVKTTLNFSMPPVEEAVREVVATIKAAGRYRPERSA